MNLEWRRVQHPDFVGHIARDRSVEPSAQRWYRVGADGEVGQTGGHKGPWLLVADADTRAAVLASLDKHLEPKNPLLSVLRCTEELEHDGQHARFYGWWIPHEQRAMTVCPFVSRDDQERFLSDIQKVGGDEHAAAFAALSLWGEEPSGERGFWLLTNSYPHQHDAINAVLERYQDYEPTWEKALVPQSAPPTPDDAKLADAREIPDNDIVTIGGEKFYDQNLSLFVDGAQRHTSDRLQVEGLMTPQQRWDSLAEHHPNDTAVSIATCREAGEDPTPAQVQAALLLVRRHVDALRQRPEEDGRYDHRREIVPVDEMIEHMPRRDRGVARSALYDAVYAFTGRQANVINAAGMDKQLTYLSVEIENDHILQDLDPNLDSEASTRAALEGLSAHRRDELESLLTSCVHEKKHGEAEQVIERGVIACVALVGDETARDAIAERLDPDPDHERIVYVPSARNLPAPPALVAALEQRGR